MRPFIASAWFFGALTACGRPPAAVPDPDAAAQPEADLAVGVAGAPGDVDITALRNGGDLFITSCRPVNGVLVCSPFRMTIAPGGKTTTTKLPEVEQPITHVRELPGLIAIPGLMGSTVDPTHRQIYWHADCDAGYHVTDIDSGVTRSFALELAGLGIAAGGGFCLGEWDYDEARQRAVVLAGHQDRGGGVNNEKSNVEYVLAVDASGSAQILQDLRGKLDPQFRFLHEFQTIASRDADRDEMIAPLQLPPTAENQLVVNLTSGAVSVVGGGSARVHRFFDVAERQQTAFDCNVPGLTHLQEGVDANPLLAIPQSQLTSFGINLCIPGFTGGGYDPVGTKELLLMRTQQISPTGLFLLGVADLATDRWLGFVDTDATYDALGMSSVAATQRLFLLTAFVPATEGPNGGTSITMASDAERRFQTAVLAPGTYDVSITGIGNADLYVRTDSPPTTTTFDCRPSLPHSNERCRVTLAAPARIHVLVRGVADTSTFRLVATAE
jgi:hypothetical protein